MTHAVRLACLALVLGGAPAAAQPDAPPRPTGPVPNCTTTECHTSITAAPFVHGPVNVGCAACHVPADPAAHTFALPVPRHELCRQCHIDEYPSAADAHAPDFDGTCLDCHDPHGGPTRELFRDTPADPGATCRACHAAREDAVAHAIAGARRHANGDCRMCHLGHARDTPHLLRATGAALCNQCHGDTMGLEEPDAGFVHGPAAVSCTPCHEPHGSNRAALVRADIAPLCLECHADTIGEPDVVIASHADTSPSACLDCHEPHHAAQRFLLRRTELDLCLSCHLEPRQRRDGTLVRAVREFTTDGAHRHAALDAGCSGCHDPHDHLGDSLLVGGYPSALYASFAPADFGLCFTCHDAAAFAASAADTRFRNGDVNLHYVHVASQGDRARSCRFCHEAHGSTAPKLMRESTPFGEWEIPIGYRSFDGGGSCAAGCHVARRYAR